MTASRPKKKTFILASQSPQRKTLLKKLNIPFTIIPSHLAEPPPGFLKPVEYAKKLALAKARIVAKQVGRGLVLGADTVVVHKNEILGKPVDFLDACRMLSRLSGTTHRVVTAVALLDAETGASQGGHAVSLVTLRRLTPAQIISYARKHMDKAGCYAVQEKKDPVVRKVRGSFTNVVGLPMEVVKKLFSKAALEAPSGTDSNP